MKIKSIKQNSETTLLILWDDGVQNGISLSFLRDMCPCAECKGETILMQHYKPTKKIKLLGYDIIEKIEVVGNYALKFIWKDGHQTGIYTFEYLEKVCREN